MPIQCAKPGLVLVTVPQCDDVIGNAEVQSKISGVSER